MTTGQTIESKITVDAKQAIAEVDKFSGKLSAVEAAAVKAGNALPAVERSAQTAGAKMLILGQAVDDAQYGLRGIVNNIPQVVQALGGGLGLAGGIGIAAVAISQLSDKYTQYNKIQEDVIANSKLWKDTLENIDTMLREGVNKRTAELTQSLKDAQTELRNFGKTSRQIAEDEAAAAIAVTERQIATLEKNLPAMREAASSSRRTALFYTDPEEANRVGAIEEAYAKAEARLSTYRGELTKQKQTLSDLVEVNRQLAEKEADEKRAERAKKIREKEVADYEKGVRDLIAYEEEWRTRQAELDEKASLERGFALQVSFELMDEERKAQEKHQKEMTKIAKREAQERKREEEKAAKEKSDAIKAAEKSTSDYQIDLARMVSSQLLSSAQGYVEAKIKGEKDAEQKAIASFLSATGQQLVASGTRAIFEGAIISANPLTPGLGAGMIATGAAAVAVGLGMGASGAALAPPPEVGGGASGAARDRGAAPRAPRGEGGGGPLVVNVSYGVAGPLPEDTAREIARAMKAGNRRRGAA